MTVCTLSALGGCAWWDQKERQLVYRPTPGRMADFNGLRPDDQAYFINVRGSNGTPEKLQIWWLPHADANAPTLLYLHGTFRNLFRNYPKIEALREAGFAVVAVDYRGWGESEPIVPSQESILADADVAWTELVRHQPEPGRRVIYGHSMGGGVAVDLASRKHYRTDYGALILESTFTSLPDVAAANGVIGTIGSWITSQRFYSIDKIGKVDAPILMMHGDADTTVPVALGRNLRDAAQPGVRWVEFPGGNHSWLHRDFPEAYQQSVKSVIQQLPTP